MSKSKPGPDQGIDPDAPRARGALRDAVRIFVDAGWPANDADWLAEHLLRELPPCGSTDSELSEAAESNLRRCASGWRLSNFAETDRVAQLWARRIASEHGSDDASLVERALHDRNAAFVLLLAALTNSAYGLELEVPGTERSSEVRHWAITVPQLAQFVSEMKAHDVQLDRALENGWPYYLESDWAHRGGPSSDDARNFRSVLLASGAATDAVLRRAETAYRERCPWATTPPSSTQQNMRARSNAEQSQPAPTASTKLDLANNVAIRRLSIGVHWWDPTPLKKRLWDGGEPAILNFVTEFSGTPNEQIADVADDVARVSCQLFANSEGARHLDAYEGFGDWKANLRAFARLMRPYFDELDRRVKPEPHDCDPTKPHDCDLELKHQWLQFFRMAFDAEPNACPEATRRRVCAVAAQGAASFRKQALQFTHDGADAAAPLFTHLLPWFRRCCLLLARHQGLFAGLKPVLLAMRALNAPCVARDLRHWDEFADDPPPSPWKAIPTLFSEMFHAEVAAIQARDDSLDALRADFSTFCLERLVDRWKQQERDEAKSSGRARTDADMLERSPSWRYAFVRAARDLRINPNGKGHHALDFSRQNDPDKRIQSAAQSAHEILRHQRGLPLGVSPRRPLMSAFWWLCQAQRSALGLEVDSDRALRTRAKQLARTKEGERSRPPTS